MSTKVNQGTQKSEPKSNYFSVAQSWCDAALLASESGKQNWRHLCLYALLPLIIVLTGSLFWLLSKPRFIPMIIHHYANGRVFVSPIIKQQEPILQAQMESELVRYVINRESYHASTYQQQYQLIHLLSDESVAQQYRHEQNSSSKGALVNILGRHDQRRVEIISIIFLRGGGHSKRRPKASYVAQVDFLIRDYDAQGALLGKKVLTTLIAWHYRAMPNNPAQLWNNWDGFTVINYQLQQRRTKHRSHSDEYAI